MAKRPLNLRERLQRFVDRWDDFYGREQQSSHRFLLELLDCYDADYPPGTLFEQHPIEIVEREENGLFGESEKTTTRDRMDLYIPRICVWEMKSPSADLGKSEYVNQILKYWGRMQTRYMVLCNFHEFWIWDTDRDDWHLQKQNVVRLQELPENPEALAFLKGDEADFAQRPEEVTKDVAGYIGGVVRDLIRRADNPQDERPRITKFALECVFAMFAEDSNLAPGGIFEYALKDAQKSGNPAPVYDLFDDFGRKKAEDRSDPHAPYVNGPIFDRQHPKNIPLDKELLADLYTASKDYDWRQVRPEIFGSIFEKALKPEKRHELGAHFTHEEDILKVVEPTVLRPWRERIKTCGDYREAERLMERMKNFHVLDPACGCGNFLYVTYREMKRLEVRLRNKHQELYKHKVSTGPSDTIETPEGPYFSIKQLHGYEVLDFAVELARVVLWIGEHLANLELDLGEQILPLRELSENVFKKDALLTDELNGRSEWFRPEEGELAIVSNPPYLGNKKMRMELGDEYVDALREHYPEHGNADYVTHWFPQAFATLEDGERCGYVTTNSIGQNESRSVSLEKIEEEGGSITDAWSTYSWPGEAAVHVTITNWKMGDYDGARYLDGDRVDYISPRLTSGPSLAEIKKIDANRKLSFQGVIPGVEEFILEEDTKNELIEKDPESTEVIRPFLIGRDLNRRPDQSPSRWIIDFDKWSREQAAEYEAAFHFVQDHVYPKVTREESRKPDKVKENWWRMQAPRDSMREALQPLSHYIATAEVGPHMIFSRIDNNCCPDHTVKVIALDSWYHFGILQSAVHEHWAWANGSTLETRLRYTNTTIFETFPFPRLPDGGYRPRCVPGYEDAQGLAMVAEDLHGERKKICQERQIGLTELYNQIDAGELPQLETLHRQLNELVCKCYGWPEDTWESETETLKRLKEMNEELTGS